MKLAIATSGVFAAILACALCAGPAQVAPSVPAPTPMPGAEWRVQFSPRGGCTDMIIEAIEGACQSIAVQAYSFTSEPIAEALVRAHARGVAVEIVLDGGQRTARASKGSYCAAAGLNVVYDEQHAIQHNKVMVIDANQVITGSFNFTGNAERANAENCLLVTGDRELARVYEENFLVHRSHARR